MIRRPRVFVGSSAEALHVAKAVQVGLDHCAEVTLWTQGVFSLTKGTLEELVKATRSFHFAVFILTPDDLSTKRGASGASPRDNVLFELGLFLGALGRDRTVIVRSRDEALDLPSDLAGVTAASYANHTDGNFVAALGAACTQIEAMLPAPTPSEAEARESRLLERAQALADLVESMATTEQIIRKAQEADDLQLELDQLRSVLSEFFCPACGSSIIERGGATETVEYGGRDCDIEHEWEEFACGRRVLDGSEIAPCGADTEPHTRT